MTTMVTITTIFQITGDFQSAIELVQIWVRLFIT